MDENPTIREQYHRFLLHQLFLGGPPTAKAALQVGRAYKAGRAAPEVAVACAGPASFL